MFAGLAALLMSGGGAFPAPVVSPTDLPHIFVAACLDGEARFARDEARSVTFNQLPKALLRQLPVPASSTVWRLDGPGRAFLYILDYPAATKASPRICGIASDEMDLHAAAPIVQKRVMGDVYPETGKSMQWTDPQGGFIVTATSAGGYNVLQTNVLSDAERAELIRKYRSVAP